MSSAWTPRVQAATLAALHDATARARTASVTLRELDRAAKDKALAALADALVQRRTEILAANAADLDALAPDDAPAAVLERLAATRDRLELTRERLEELAYGLLTIAAAPDPIGEVLHSRRQRSGVQWHQIRVPVGVVAVLYEGAPAVVVRAAGLLLKTGNALLLRDCLGRASRGDAALVRIVRDVFETHGVPPDAIQLMTGDRRAYIKASMRHVLTASDEVDLVLPLLERGVPAQLLPEASVPIVPVIPVGGGNRHVYVDASADLAVALRVVLDRRGGPVEKVLVHAAVAPAFVPVLGARLRDRGVTVHAERRFAAWTPEAVPATEDDWVDWYGSPDVAGAVVSSLDEACAHIARYGGGHTETIVTEDEDAARAFTARVDAATVTVNAPSPFVAGNPVDPDLGYSTQRLHPRGPLNLTEFTSTKWVAWPTRHAFSPLPSRETTDAHHPDADPEPDPAPPPAAAPEPTRTARPPTPAPVPGSSRPERPAPPIPAPRAESVQAHRAIPDAGPRPGG